HFGHLLQYVFHKCIGLTSNHSSADESQEQANHCTLMKAISTILCATLSAGFLTTTTGADLDTVKIDQLTGLKGKMNQSEGVYKVTFPRDDVKIVVDGWTMPP